MADRLPIFPHVTTSTYALVEQVCQAQGCTPSDVVEGALLAYLAPREPSERDVLLFQKLSSLEKDVHSLLPLLEKIIAHLAAQAQPTKPTVASYEQLYGEQLHGDALQDAEDAVDDMPLDDPPQPGGWRRLFPKRSTP
jgi:hypothetical protein